MVIRNTPRIVLIYSSYHVRTLPQTSWKSACSFVGNVANIQTERLTETTAVITKILLLMAVTRSHLHQDYVIKWKPFSRYWPFEFPSRRPVPLSFDLCLNKRLSRQSTRGCLKTPSRSLCRHNPLQSRRQLLVNSSGILSCWSMPWYDNDWREVRLSLQWHHNGHHGVSNHQPHS